jgi:hypothetical protein
MFVLIFSLWYIFETFFLAVAPNLMHFYEVFYITVKEEISFSKVVR